MNWKGLVGIETKADGTTETINLISGFDDLPWKDEEINRLSGRFVRW